MPLRIKRLISKTFVKLRKCVNKISSCNANSIGAAVSVDADSCVAREFVWLHLSDPESMPRKALLGSSFEGKKR